MEGHAHHRGHDLRIGSWSQFVSVLKARMGSDWDNMIGIQGERGAGKSTLALWIALNLDPGFQPNQVFYESQEWKQVIHPKKRGQVFVLDEGTNIAFNRTWQNRDQVSLMQLLNTIRQRNHTMIWCAPNLERMDVVVRADILKFRISVVRRGLALVQERVHNWRDGTTSWKDCCWIRYGSLQNHPIWVEYVRRKSMSYQSRVNRTNATEVVAVEDSNPMLEDSVS